MNEQNQVQPPPDNKRNRILKLLALKVAAHLKWDLDVLEKRYLSFWLAFYDIDTDHMCVLAVICWGF